MKKYTKVLVTLVIVVLVSSVGFTTAFGRGSSRRTPSTPVITLAPQAPVGQVLGQSTESTSSFITRLVSMNIISPSMVPFINLLISLGIIK